VPFDRLLWRALYVTRPIQSPYTVQSPENRDLLCWSFNSRTTNSISQRNAYTVAAVSVFNCRGWASFLTRQRVSLARVFVGVFFVAFRHQPSAFRVSDADLMPDA
jgi:hypothetical protein